MQQIHADLIKIKTAFPQLSAIDSAEVSSNRFHYSKGWVSDHKIKGATFEKDGGDIDVWIRYPARTDGDVQQLLGSPFLRLGNGKHLVFWRSVRAEPTGQANRFKTAVDKVVSENMGKMLNSLGHKRNDFVLELPENRMAEQRNRSGSRT